MCFGWGFKKKRDPLEVATEEVTAANVALRNNDQKTAAGAYERAAAAYGQTTMASERAKYLLESARLYESFDVQQAARVTSYAISDLVAQGQYRRAATHALELGDVCKRGNNLSEAMHWYEKAAGWYEQEGSRLLSNKAYIAYADLAALNGEPLKAADVFAKVAKASVTTASAGWNVKEYCERAIMSLLIAKEYAQATELRIQFCSWDRQFAASRENFHLERVIHAAASRDLEQYENALFDWDQQARLNSWMVEASLIVKKQITDEELL